MTLKEAIQILKQTYVYWHSPNGQKAIQTVIQHLDNSYTCMATMVDNENYCQGCGRKRTDNK